jgi:hypothetical protein
MGAKRHFEPGLDLDLGKVRFEDHVAAREI